MKIGQAALNGLQGAFAISDIGRCDRNSMRQAMAIDQNMALDARDFLAGVIAFFIGRVGVFHALRVNDDKAGTGVSHLSDTRLYDLIFKARSSILIPCALILRHLA